MDIENYWGNILNCPHCHTLLDRETLYRSDCLCIHCGEFIDVEEMLLDDYDDYLEEMEEMYSSYRGSEQRNQKSLFDYDDYEEKYRYEDEPSEEEKDTMEEQICTFSARFMTEQDYNTLKKGFDALGLNIDYLVATPNGLITDFCESTGGVKLLKGLNLKKENLEEYHIIFSYILKDVEAKRALVATLAEVFPLCIIKEEESLYIMANNKGLAKGIVEWAGEDAIQISSIFLTGWEKYKILTDYLWWCPPYNQLAGTEIMIKWKDSSLVSLKTLRDVKQVPYEWTEFLTNLDGLLISKSKADAGSNVSFETMLEDTYERLVESGTITDDDFIKVVSLRGTNEFAARSDKDDDKK